MVLNPVISKLSGKLVVLASASPRRLEILRNAKHLKTPDIVIGADTIVTVDGMILEKPVDKFDAYKMLSSLSGKEHSVFTGVAIVLCHEKEEVDYQLIDFYEETKVKFADLSDDLLWEYVNSGEPMDKAGGYGIQALGGMLVEYVHGDFLNVVGFPLNHFCKQLDCIYNRWTSSSAQESASVHVSHNGIHTTPVLTQPPSNVPAELSGSESATLQQMTSPGQVVQLNVTEHEDNEPRKEDLQRITELMDGFKASKALFTASKLHVFDLLQSRPGLDAAQVAQELKASVKGTECLLEACVSLGLLKSKGRKYENTALATRFLWSESPFSLHGYIQHCDSTVWPLFSHLESAVWEGTNQHEKAFGKKSKDIFQDSYYNSQEVKLRFMNAMHSIAKVTGAAVAKAFDLSSYKTACDLGGCTGAMAYEFAKAHPGLSVTVFDLPAVVEMSDHFHPLHTNSRVSFVAGDFFKDDLPKADLYILARILHDWPDEKVHVLLRKIADACAPGCGLLLSEIFLDEDRRGPSRGLLQALSMSEGKQRSSTEYSLLLKSHGFVTAHVRHTDNLLDAMLCIKV
uniref:Acetylserotonin O-methyltransferase-like n=1 Tax=Anabas testudineus TaxID=64144 RepID=A0A3Q1HL76_ANATE